MLAYVTVGTSDIEKSKAFYSALLADVEAKIVMDLGRLVAFGTDQGGTLFSICTPFDKGAPHQGNGNMVSFAAGSRERVDQLYAKAMALGGVDEGEPGERMDGFYGAYFRDPDGNKICFSHFG